MGRLVPGFTYHHRMLSVGDKAPSFTLPAIDGGEEVTDPWTEGPTVLAFFKVSCPVCKMVAPMLTKLSEGGARVVAVGQDPPEVIAQYRESQGQRVPSVSEPAPYEVSEAYGLEAVPTLFLVGPDGGIQEALPGWNRDTWNELAATLGLAEPLSTPDDGLRPFRPG
jgi:peroxiredoxin